MKQQAQVRILACIKKIHKNKVSRGCQFSSRVVLLSGEESLLRGIWVLLNLLIIIVYKHYS